MSDEVSDVPSRRFRPRFSLLVLMLVMTGICILLAWIVQPERVTATALFEVSSSSESPFRDPSTPLDDKGFDVLKKTQIAKLKSTYVLTAAVRNPRVAGLPILNGKPDVVEWLSQKIEVGFPEDGEILEISLTGLKAHSNDIIQIVDAVAKAYKDEVIGAERQRRLGTRDLLSRNFEDLNEEIKRDLNEYTDLAREIGSIESGRGQVLQELDAKRLDRIDEALMRLENEAANDAAKAESFKPRMTELRARQTALEKQLTDRAERSADLQVRRSKLESLQRAATEFAVKLELLEIEASAPDAIRQIQPAVIKPND